MSCLSQIAKEKGIHFAIDFKNDFYHEAHEGREEKDHNSGVYAKRLLH